MNWKSLLTVSSLVVVATSRAWAALGGAPSTPAGTQAMAAHAQTYDSFTYMLGSGTHVTEYASAQGVVFAVTWAGPVLPDLETLLGRYFPEFTAQAAQRPGGPQTPVHAASGDLRVVSRGHMGALRGSAWVTSLLPQGFDLGTLQ